MSPDPDERPVVAVYTCSDESEADVVTGLLREYGIESFRSSELSHNVFPVTGSELGQVTILVDEDKVEEAQKVIAERLEQSGESPESAD